MFSSTRNKLFGYGTTILKSRINRQPVGDEVLMYLRSEAAALNPQGGPSLSALSQRQADRLAAVLKGYIADLPQYIKQERRRKHQRLSEDSPWASEAHKKFYIDLCRWADWSDSRRDGYLKHMTGVDSPSFQVGAKELGQCIEGTIAIIAREAGVDKSEIRRKFKQETGHGWYSQKMGGGR